MHSRDERRRAQPGTHVVLALFALAECPSKHGADGALAYAALSAEDEDLVLDILEAVCDLGEVRVGPLWCGCAGLLVWAACTACGEAGLLRLCALYEMNESDKVCQRDEKRAGWEAARRTGQCSGAFL